MLDLTTIAGLPLGLDDAGQMVFGPDVVVDESKARLVDELVPVAMEPEACRGNREVAYYMANGVYRRGDAGRLADLPFRYELTLIPERRIGREYVKTFGHIHTPEPQSGLAWCEVCEVLVGTAHFIYQTLDPSEPGATLAYYVEARAGEKILVPPDLDHATINPGPGPLVFSDVVALGIGGNYDRFRATRGAAYYEVVDGGQPRFVANPAYRRVPPLRQVAVRDYPALDLTRDEPLYTAFLRGRAEKWGFLADPRLFASSFRDLAAEIGA